jgi:LmbE family N-acetylglucosaminyl deacetylase
MSDSSETTPLVSFVSKTSRQFVHSLGQLAKNDAFKRTYAVAALSILLITTLLWAWLGARLQAHNADQLSDPYLFSNWQTFHGASFPGAHTFLLKWPIFWLMSLYGTSQTSLLAATVGVVLLTLATLVFILYKIDRRPLAFGTLCLALALALLLVPAQPYAGGLLPVNMAMLTTRNLEYAVYLVALVCFAKTKRIRDWNFALATLLLAVLIASDKLFLSLSAGGALLALIIYTLVSNWGLASFAARWLMGSVLAAAGALGALGVITATNLTHLTNTVTATPYGVVHSSKSLLLAVAYSVLGLLTNVGANPAYDNRVLSQLPNGLVHRLWSLGGLAYLTAGAILLCAVALAWLVLRTSLHSAPRRAKMPVANLLAWMLIWSTVAAFGVFIATEHYFAVDARYLTIAFFALAVSAAVGLRKVDWKWPEDLLLVGCVLGVAVVLAVPTALRIYTGQTRALDTLSLRDALIADALKQHKVNVLVGDYWRVLPTKLASGGVQIVTPLASCAEPAQVLTSRAWQPDLKTHSFAYLISLDNSGNLANFSHCSLQQITATYGLPNATQIIAGTPAKPTEALLFYDRGSHPLEHVQRRRSQAQILPVPLSELTSTSCSKPTTMNIVAHEDDDLLFLSPDLLHDIQSGRCVRTVYLTAGDAGIGRFYWLNRQLGSEAAYTAMLGDRVTLWDQQTVELATGEYITVASPRGNTKISLIFFNLPDGGMHGQGFEASGYNNLAKLHDGVTQDLRSVDGQSDYTSQQLVDALTLLMNAYQPANVHTQADVPSALYPDHSDHIATGHYALAAATQYDQQHFGGAVAIPITRYVGYPIHGYATNVSGLDLTQKEAAFLAYAQYDGGVCQTLVQCVRTPTYGAYIVRQYTEEPLLQP